MFARGGRARVEPRVADLHDPILRPVVEEARVADEFTVEIRCEAHVDRSEPRVEQRAALVRAEAHPPPSRSVLRDLPQRLGVPRLERLEPDAPALQRYVKRQVPPSSNERRMRRATTILCTSSAPS